MTSGDDLATVSALLAAIQVLLAAVSLKNSTVLPSDRVVLSCDSKNGTWIHWCRSSSSFSSPSEQRPSGVSLICRYL
jgi:hypothetical protein